MLKGYVEADHLLEILEEMVGKESCVELVTYCTGTGVDILKKVHSFPIYDHGHVPHRELIDAYEDSDILVNIAEKEGRQISSKIFEYMSTGKPILHVYYSENDINIRYLSDYPLSQFIRADMKKDEIKEIKSWMQKSRGRRCPYDFVEQKYWRFTPKYIAKDLLNVF